MKEHATKVFRRAPERLNCAQAVLDAYQSVSGKHVASLAAFKAFGGGRAPGGECGALYAACQALPDSAAAIRAAFAARTNTTLCRELEAIPCTECVALAAELMQQGATSSEGRTVPSNNKPVFRQGSPLAPRP